MTSLKDSLLNMKIGESKVVTDESTGYTKEWACYTRVSKEESTGFEPSKEECPFSCEACEKRLVMKFRDWKGRYDRIEAYCDDCCLKFIYEGYNYFDG
jgi:hypothetical protein